MNQKNFFYFTVVIALCSALFGCQQVKQPLTTLAQEKTAACSYKVVETYPHDNSAFTQGLIYDRGDLYESTGIKGQSSIRKVDLETGKVLEINSLDDRYFAEGMTLWQDRLIQLTWTSQTGFVYDKNLKQIATFSYPTEGWGLTHNNKELILSDGSNILYFLDPDTYQETRKIEVTEEQINPSIS